MPPSIQSGEDAGARGRARRRGGEGVGEPIHRQNEQSITNNRRHEQNVDQVTLPVNHLKRLSYVENVVRFIVESRILKLNRSTKTKYR